LGRHTFGEKLSIVNQLVCLTEATCNRTFRDHPVIIDNTDSPPFTAPILAVCQSPTDAMFVC